MKKLKLFLFSLVLVLATACFLKANDAVVHAADETLYIDAEKDFIAEKTSITNSQEIPSAKATGYEDWLFAGWYTDKECTSENAYKSISGKIGESAWAKFVPSDLLEVKVQLTKGTTSSTKKTNMRLVSSVDTVNYSAVGFYIEYHTGEDQNGDKKEDLVTKEFIGHTVYDNIIASEESGIDYKYNAKVIDSKSLSFITATITNINSDKYENNFVIKAFWVTPDGTRVYGQSRYVQIQDAYNNWVNVSVKADSQSEFDALSIKEATIIGRRYYTGQEYGALMVSVEKRSALPSLTKYTVMSNDTEVSTENFRNLVSPLGTITNGIPKGDSTWYSAISDEDEFVIVTAADLYGFTELTDTTTSASECITFEGKRIYLGADITINELGEGETAAALKTKATDEDATNNPLVWIPIGAKWDRTNGFKGTFDGVGKTIRGIYFVDSSTKTSYYNGFFGSAIYGSTIRDFRLEDSYFQSVEGNNNGYAMLGSIVGQLGGNMDTVYSNATVISGNEHVGGLIGRINTDNTGNTTNNKNKIDNCWFDGSLTINMKSCMSDVYAGGILGRNTRGHVTMTNCLNTGSISYTYTDAPSEKEYNLQISGIAGSLANNSSSAKYCVSMGEIAIQATEDVTFNKTDAIADKGVQSNNFSITTADAKKYNGHLGYSLMSDTVIGTATGIKFYNSEHANEKTNGKWVCQETDSAIPLNGTPVLKSFCEDWIDVSWYYDNPSEEATNYSIADAKELLGFADIYISGNTFNGKTINLVNDISLNPDNAVTKYANGTSSKEPATDWRAAGDKQFAGTFDGHGHTISGIYTMTASANVGLFGIIANESIVRNLKITDSYFYTTMTGNAIIGSIAGECRGTIDSVYSEAIVKSKGNRVGGIVGVANGPIPSGQTIYGTATINNSWFNGRIDLLDGATNSGGLIGLTMQGNVYVTNCLVTGSINNATKKTDAGLIGYVGNAGARNMVVNISNSVVALDGEVTNKNVGNLIGTIKNNDSGTTVTRKYTIVNTYVTEESFSGDNIISDNKEDDVAAIVGEGVSQVEGSTAFVGSTLMRAEADLQGVKGYENTLLDFYVSETDAGEWVARSGMVPGLKVFVDGNVVSLDEASQTGWYDDSINSYYLATVSAFKAFRDYVNNGTNFNGKIVYLADDMDLNPNWKAPKDASESVTGNPDAWSPIGTSSAKFSGTFDGQNHIIRGLYVNTATENAGLFGIATDNVSTIQNLRINNAYVYSSSKNVGSVIGYAQRTKLMNIYSDAYVKGNNRNVGGLVGFVKNASTAKDISNCWFDGTAIGTQFCGGIVGCYNYGKTARIANSLFTGTVHTTLDKANAQTGGIVGGTDNPTAYKNIVLTFSSCLSAGTITESYAKGDGHVGGVIGYRPENTDLIIENVYTTEALGIGTDSDANKETDTTNIVTNEENFYGLGAYMLTNLDFTSPKWAARAGKLPVPETLVADNEKLTIRGNKPDLDITDQGAGTEENPYIIENVEELYGFAILSRADAFKGKYIKLSDDIEGGVLNLNPGESAEDWAEGTAASLPWYSIGVGKDGLRFAGHFDGNGKTISGIYMNSDSSYLGLFAATESGSTISNLRLTNSYINYTGDGTAYTGSVVGDLRGDITEVYSDAIVNSNGTQSGGLVGRVNAAPEEDTTYEALSITNCWYDGQLTSSKTYAGGLLASVANGTVNVDNCLNTGTIITTVSDVNNAVAGICAQVAGESNLTITDTISAGKITAANHGKNVKSVVGYIPKGTVNFEDVFATKTSYARHYPSKGGAGSYTGTVLRVQESDRFIGYCEEEIVEKVEDVNYYLYPELEFGANEWTIRTSDVPVPTCFADLVTPVTTDELNSQIGLDYLNTALGTTLTLANAVDMGEGNYVLRATVNDDGFANYKSTLEGLGFGAPVVENVADRVHSVSYKQTNPDWVVTLTYVETTDALTISINTNIKSLSDKLVSSDDEITYATGDVKLTMLQMEEMVNVLNENEEVIGQTELKDIYADLSSYNILFDIYQSYWYGNSFVFQVSENHFVVIDGGAKEEYDDLVNYMKAAVGKTGDEEQKPVYIDAWIISHQHGDHADAIKAVADDPTLANGIYVDAFYLSEPNAKILTDNALYDDAEKQYYAMTLFAKNESGEQSDIYRMHTGQRYNFNGFVMDVIQTQDQITYSAYGDYNATTPDKRDFNTASTVTLFSTGTQKVLIGGDANYANMDYIMKAYDLDETDGESNYTPTSLLQNINVFVAFHHGKNMSMKLRTKDTSFVDYLTYGGHMFDHVLYPCSLVYGDTSDPINAFPNAGEVNEYLNSKAHKYAHFGNGKVEITLNGATTE